jgi:hypothetical protein
MGGEKGFHAFAEGRLTQHPSGAVSNLGAVIKSFRGIVK